MLNPETPLEPLFEDVGGKLKYVGTLPRHLILEKLLFLTIIQVYKDEAQGTHDFNDTLFNAYLEVLVNDWPKDEISLFWDSFNFWRDGTSWGAKPNLPLDNFIDQITQMYLSRINPPSSVSN
jgi:hypothetical protein